ncbi:hypothetical protein PTTG_01295 [Puccinia triticina 1-1 BBBD Race 1]|uniref:No apical meristem-associated C-terminal domain-containing protein n=1 Tax=Puccinia triticina (isolate 1-1 / race 1 (BBBD)) TaxID=630390 RepID=A0A180G2X0_PUCT1|nr:hypothetical protein PTTG_01295 [Puccinia triticina 1-1 BBBD Race 1]
MISSSTSYVYSEGIQLCQAWITVLEDVVVGTNQEGMTFWAQVKQCFKRYIRNSIQSASSLKTCWALLQKVIHKFQGCVNQVEQYSQSGASANDCLNRALQLFSKDQKTRFKHLVCHNILIKVPKWCAYVDENSKKAQEAGKNK